MADRNDGIDAGSNERFGRPMDAGAFTGGDESPTVEVRVFRHGVLVRRELVESEEQAALVVDEWAELDGVSCEVDDLSIRHRAGQVFEPELGELPDEDAYRQSRASTYETQRAARSSD